MADTIYTAIEATKKDTCLVFWEDKESAQKWVNWRNSWEQDKDWVLICLNRAMDSFMFYFPDRLT